MSGKSPLDRNQHRDRLWRATFDEVDRAGQLDIGELIKILIQPLGKVDFT